MSQCGLPRRFSSMDLRQKHSAAGSKKGRVSASPPAWQVAGCGAHLASSRCFDAIKSMQVGELTIRKSPAATALKVSRLRVFFKSHRHGRITNAGARILATDGLIN